VTKQRKHLFICGCPRSGTTALWSLMVAHPAIALGVERYILLCYQKNKISPVLFDKSKFFDLQPGETFYSDLFSFNPYYRTIEKRFENALWVGDKAPTLYLDYNGVEHNFENAHILFISRNIIDVAGSYQKRATDKTDGSWNASRDYRRAVSDWNESLKLTLEFFNTGGRRTTIHVISYEELFLEEADLRPLFETLELDVTSSVRDEYRRLLGRSAQLDAARGDALNSSQRCYITTHASFGLWRHLLPRRLALSKSDIAVPSPAGPVVT